MASEITTVVYEAASVGNPFTTQLFKLLDQALGDVWKNTLGKKLDDFFKARERKAAFGRALNKAHEKTLQDAPAPQTEEILAALEGKLDKPAAAALAQETHKLLLSSESPDLAKLTALCESNLRYQKILKSKTPSSSEAIAQVLSSLMVNLRLALLDEPPYHDLMTDNRIVALLEEIAASVRPKPTADEAAYRKQVAEINGQLDFIGIPELKDRRPITVKDIFIKLNAEPQREPRDEQELLEAYRRAEAAGDEAAQLRLIERRNPLTHTPGPQGPVAVERVLRETNKLVILGDPGSGKTTLLKYLAVICAEGHAESELKLTSAGGPLLPLLVPLREYAAECVGRTAQDYCLLDYFYTYAREHLLLTLPPNFFEEALKSGRALVCLDGLDEVWAVGQRKEVTEAVRALAALYPKSRYLVSSRLVGYDAAPLDPRDFLHCKVLPLSDDDIAEFVSKWYALRERDAAERTRKTNDLIATIKREPRIKDLATNPLLLTIIALVHRIEAQLPHERVKLYDKCVTALVDTWEEIKHITLSVDERKRPYYVRRRRLLERLAYELHAGASEPRQLRTISQGDLELTLMRFLQEMHIQSLAEDADAARGEAQAFIVMARGRTGLLVEKGEEVFGFPHLTFQEYLAACDIDIRFMPDGVNAIWEQIKDRLHNPHWREVILLLLGSLSRYESAPTKLVQKILESRESDRFEPVLRRNLYLAARVLADRVNVYEDVRRRIVDELLGIARDASSWERNDAFAALGSLPEDRHAAEGLLALARDEKVEAGVRSAAASSLGQLGRAEEAAEILLALARDEKVNAGVRSAAASSLGQLGRAEEAAEILLALARDEKVDAGVRSAAVRSLIQLGRAEEAAEILLVLARDEKVDAWVRSAAASSLGQFGHADEAAEILLSLVRDEKADTLVRSAAAISMGELGRAAGQRLDALLALARDEKVDAGMRSYARIRSRSGGADEATAFVTLAHNGKVDPLLCSYVLGFLSGIGRADEQVVDALLALARDEKVAAWVRSPATRSLGQLGRADEQVVDALLALARDEKVEAWVRRDAASSLGQLGRADQAADLLLALARDEKVEAGVRSNAASALGQLGCADQAADLLLALARDEKMDDEVRRNAYQSLKQLPGGDAQP